MILLLEAEGSWQSLYSMTISAISEDLGIANEKPISGPTLDTTLDQSIVDSSGGEKCSTQELDS